MEKKRKVRLGSVVSNKMNKTVIVAVQTRRTVPLYKKVITQTTKLQAHDESNVCKVGDIVRIVETRPLSKCKSWRVVQIIERGGMAEIPVEEVQVDSLEKVASPTSEKQPQLPPSESEGALENRGSSG